MPTKEQQELRSRMDYMVELVGSYVRGGHTVFSWDALVQHTNSLSAAVDAVLPAPEAKIQCNACGGKAVSRAEYRRGLYQCENPNCKRLFMQEGVR